MEVQQPHPDQATERDLGNRPTQQGHNRPRRQSAWLYFLLLAVQTAGAVLLLSNWIPLYQTMAQDFAKYTPDPTPWWAVAGVVLIQAAYWPQLRLQPPVPRRGGVVLGHIILFVARVSFVSVTASFAMMFFNRFESLRDMQYSPIRALLVLVMFFTVFCWTFELERLAAALRKGRT